MTSRAPGRPPSVLIIAGTLTVAPTDRADYLRLTSDVARLARETPGCLDFVQAADPLDPGRINIFERWESEAPLLAFRALDEGDPVELPPVQGADVRRYEIAGVGDP